MSDLVGNHIVGFPTRPLKYLTSSACFYMCYRPAAKLITMRTAYVRKIFRSVRIRNQTLRIMYTVKISGTQIVFGFMRTQIKLPLQLSQNDNFSFSFVWLLCQQSKSSYNINAVFDHSILHIISSVVIPYTCCPFSASVKQIVSKRFIHEALW